MQPDRIRHRQSESPREPYAANLLMAAVGVPLADVIGRIPNHVTDIVQQRGKHEFGGGSCRARKMRGLQAVLQYRYRLAEVRTCSRPLEDGHDFVRDSHIGFVCFFMDAAPPACDSTRK